jgi:GNAT superfamily N-acetyltransferase
VDPLERAFAFERAMHGAVGRVVTSEWGQAFVTPALDRCYDRNLLWVVGDGGPDVTAARVDALAERLLGGAGMLHRRVLAEPAADARLRDGLVMLGYDAGAHVVMAHHGRASDVGGLPVPVAEVGADALQAAVERYLTTDPATPYGRDPVTLRHLLEHHAQYGVVGGAERRFAVVTGDGVVAWARLWRRGDVAQIEDVVCLAEHRGHGYGRAVVAAATRAALDEGADLVFIVADDDDWPKELYGRLGFEAVGRLGVFQRFAPR